MEPSKDYISQLIWLELTGQISEEQMEELARWSSLNQSNASILERTKLELSRDLSVYNSIDVDSAWLRLEETFGTSTSETPKIKAMKTWPIYWASASIIFLISIGVIWFSKKGGNAITENSGVVADISPGSNGAILTLSDGREVSLDTIKNGEIVLEGGVKAVVVNGKLVYDDHNNGQPNTISTAKGKQYSLVLSDGTMVWLNSASSIRFPTFFSATKRMVEITGEVYFEVAKDRKKPFYVATPQGMEIKVTGTKFNLNTYKDEDIFRATLLEGQIFVSYDQQYSMLSPGEEASLVNADKAARIKIMKNVDVAKATAWKDGRFNFDDEPLPVVMRQLERWYDIEVIYQGAIPNTRFFGEISRNESLKDVLRALQESGVRFKLEKERRLIVLEE